MHSRLHVYRVRRRRTGIEAVEIIIYYLRVSQIRKPNFVSIPPCRD